MWTKNINPSSHAGRLGCRRTISTDDQTEPDIVVLSGNTVVGTMDSGDCDALVYAC
jgi:hypothetical protein